MTTPNVELLEQVMQHIEDHPELHDQAFWGSEPECGTAMCFVGWAARLSELKSEVVEGTILFRNGRGRLGTTSEAAEHVLGLSEEEADTLFCAANTRPMLRLMVKDLANGAGLRTYREYRAEAGAR